MAIAEANEPFAKGVQIIISEKGLKQVFVAEKAGYKAQELSDMLNGRKLIKACDIVRLSLALNVTADDIYATGQRGG